MRQASLAAIAAGVVLLCTAAAPAVTPVPAPSIAYTVPVVGTTAEYSNGAVYTVREADESGWVLIEQQHPELGHMFVRYYYGIGRLSLHWSDENGAPEAALRSFDEAIFADVWPLSVGHAASFTMLELDTDGNEEHIAATLEVVELREMKTPLGDVLTGLIRLDYDIDGAPDRRNAYDMWFAEGFGLPVRLDLRLDYTSDDPVLETMELVSVTLPE